MPSRRCVHGVICGYAWVSAPDAVKQTLERGRLQELLRIKRCYVLNWIFKFSRLLQTYLQERVKKKEKIKENILEAVDW